MLSFYGLEKVAKPAAILLLLLLYPLSAPPQAVPSLAEQANIVEAEGRGCCRGCGGWI